MLVEETAITPSPNNTARQMEVQLGFELAPGNMAGGNISSLFKVGARVLTGNDTYVDCFINGTVVPVPVDAQTEAGAAGVIGSMFVFVDRTNAGGYSNTTYMEGGPVPLPVNGYRLLPQHMIQLSVFVDHTIVSLLLISDLLLCRKLQDHHTLQSAACCDFNPMHAAAESLLNLVVPTPWPCSGRSMLKAGWAASSPGCTPQMTLLLGAWKHSATCKGATSPPTAKSGQWKTLGSAPTAEGGQNAYTA